VGLWQRAKKRQVCPIDSQAEANHCQARKNSDEDGKQQKETIFVEDPLDRGEHSPRSLKSPFAGQLRCGAVGCGIEAAHRSGTLRDFHLSLVDS
jgi:hypothetical protein